MKPFNAFEVYIIVQYAYLYHLGIGSVERWLTHDEQVNDHATAPHIAFDPVVPFYNFRCLVIWRSDRIVQYGIFTDV